MARRSSPLPLVLGALVVAILGLVVWQLDLLGTGDALPEPGDLVETDLIAEREAVDRGSPLAPADPLEDVDVPPPPSVSKGAIDLGPRRGSVEGRLVNANRSPVAGATIALLKGEPIPGLDVVQDFERLTRSQATTDADGRFTFTDVLATTQMVVDADGDDIAPTRAGPFTIVPDKTTDVGTIVAEAGVVVVGTVFDRGDRPVAGARIGLHHGLPSVAPDGSVSRALRLVVSDEKGRFEISGVGRASGALYVEAEGFASQYRPFSADSDETRRIEVSITLQPPAPIRGRVVSKPEGRAIEGALVEAIPVGQKDAGLGATTSGPDGTFALEALAPGSYMLRATHEDHSSVTQQGVRGGTDDVVLGLKRRASMYGVVRTEDGAPVRRYDLRARYTERKTIFATGTGTSRRIEDVDGAFSLPSLDPGFYTLEVWAPGYALTITDPIRMRQGTDLHGVLVELVPAATIVGRLVDDEDRPIRGVEVSMHPNDEPDDPMLRGTVGKQPWLLSTTTDSDGRFRLDPVSEMTYQIQFDQADHELVRVNDVTATAGASTDMGTITLSRSSSLGGYVVDSGGQPVSGITVHLTRADGLMTRRTTTNSEGKFVFDRLSEGEYATKAYSKSFGLAGSLKQAIAEARRIAQQKAVGERVTPFSGVYVAAGEAKTINITLIEN